MKYKECTWFQLGLSLNDEFPNSRQYGARHALIVLTAINLFNYADRYVPSSVKQLIIDDLKLSDFQSSLPNLGMTLVYMVFSVLFGYLADNQIFDRRTIMWLGIMFWSIATSLAGLSTNLLQLILFRSLVGMGEASYGTMAPPMLSDFYPIIDRNVVYGIYFLAIPIGGALGFGIGAVLGGVYGWRVAFLACGAPGIVLSILVLKLNNPKRGINDNEENRNSNDKSINVTLLEEDSKSVESNDNNLETLLIKKKSKCFDSSDSVPRNEFRIFVHDIYEILINPPYMYATAGLIASNFALGGLAEWLATFLLRYDGFTLDTAGLVVGAATVIGGIGGTLIGSKVSEHYKFRIKNTYFLIPALFSIPGAICVLFALNITTSDSNFGIQSLIVILIIVAEICVWTYLAPISAISITCIPPHLRSKSCAVQIFLQHILGDVISPPIIGAISDYSSLQTGLQLTWIAFLVSAILWYLGSRLDSVVPEFDQQQLLINEPDDENNNPFVAAGDVANNKKAGNYREVLCGSDDFTVNESGAVIRKLN